MHAFKVVIDGEWTLLSLERQGGHLHLELRVNHDQAKRMVDSLIEQGIKASRREEEAWAPSPKLPRAVACPVCDGKRVQLQWFAGDQVRVIWCADCNEKALRTGAKRGATGERKGADEDKEPSCSECIHDALRRLNLKPDEEWRRLLAIQHDACNRCEVQPVCEGGRGGVSKWDGVCPFALEGKEKAVREEGKIGCLSCDEAGSRRGTTRGQ